MAIRQWLVPLITSTLLMLLTACGGGGGPDDGGALSQAEAETLSTLAVGSDRFLIAMIQDPFSLTIASSTASAAPLPLFTPLGASGTKLSPLQSEECVTESGDTADADQDGIPVNATYTIDCDYTDPSFGSLSLKGTLGFSDKDDSDPLSGYKAEISNYDYVFSGSGANITLSMDLTIDFSVTADSYAADYTLNYEVSGDEASGSLSYDYSLTYTPADTSDPFAAGTFVVDGSMDFESGGERYNLTVQTTPNLLYSSTCNTSFIGGSAQYADSEGNTLAVGYSGCDNVTVSYNGSPLRN